jgi:hypothetical protein
MQTFGTCGIFCCRSMELIVMENRGWIESRRGVRRRSDAINHMKTAMTGASGRQEHYLSKYVADMQDQSCYKQMEQKTGRLGKRIRIQLHRPVTVGLFASVRPSAASCSSIQGALPGAESMIAMKSWSCSKQRIGRAQPGAASLQRRFAPASGLAVPIFDPSFQLFLLLLRAWDYSQPDLRLMCPS